MIHARLAAEQGALVLQAREATAESLRRAARREDALHSSAEECTASPPDSSAEIDAAVPSDASRDGRAEIENGPPLAIETVRRLLCDASIVPMLALVEANLAFGIGPRTCIPEWMGEKPDYDWITDALWRRDERGREAALASACTSANVAAS